MPDETVTFVPGYHNNVFISYRWLDNQAKWVNVLHSFLDRRMKELLGIRDARIWRDSSLKAGDVLAANIDHEVDGSAVFITVLSPSFMQPSYCHQEARRFRDVSMRRQDLSVGRSSRWIRVVKTPYDRSQEPDFLRDLEETIELRFYQEVPQTQGRMREFAAESAEFEETAEELAQAICGLLRKMQRKVEPRPATLDQPRVYVAETASDRRSDRDFILTDLAENCDIVPATPLPVATREEIEARLAHEFAGCVLSVHILGARYGAVPEGEPPRSIPRLHFEHASGIRRLVWIPEELPDVEVRQQEFFSYLEAVETGELEIVRSGRTAFLQHVRDVLETFRKPAEPPAPLRSVYLVSQKSELPSSQLRDLADCIRAQGFFVEQPVFDGDLADLQEAEQLSLQETDATIICFGAARDAWVRARRRQILKALGELDLASRYPRAIYLCVPETDVKRGVYM